MSKQIIPQSGSVQTHIVDISNANFDELYAGTPRASHLGMSESNTGTQNRDALRVAVAVHDIIYVDGLFPVNTVTGWIPFGGSITLVGNGASGFIMEGTSSLFRPASSGETLFMMYNMNFILNSAGCSLHYSADGEYCEKYHIENCRFEGYVSALKIIGGDYDPDTVDAGTRSIIVRNNTFKDNYNSIFYLTDCPVKVEIVEGNVITNLNGEFYHHGQANGSTWGPTITNRKEVCIIRNNKLINDASFFPDTCPSTYMALATVEAKEVLYTGNLVSGLKVKEDNQSVYDAYLSAGHVVYTNNVWLNNVNFSLSGVAHNQLIKGKSNASTEVLIPTRIYEGNLWRVEDNWILESGKVSTDVWNNFMEVPPNCDLTFKNNIIDVKGLVSDTGQDTINSFVFNDNEIRFEFLKTGGGDALMNFKPSNSRVKDNFMCRNNFQITGALDDSQALIRSDISVIWDTFHFNDNVINCPNYSLWTILYGMKFTNLNMSNNTINSDVINTFNNTHSVNFYGKNNVVNTTNSGTTMYADIGSLGVETIDFEMTSLNEGNIKISIQEAPTVETWTEVYISIGTGSGTTEVMMKIRIFDNVGTWSYQTYDSGDTLQTRPIGTGNITSVKLKQLGDFDSGMTVFFENGSTPSLDTVSEPSGVLKKSIKIKTFKGTGNFTNLLS